MYTVIMNETVNTPEALMKALKALGKPGVYPKAENNGTYTPDQSNPSAPLHDIPVTQVSGNQLLSNLCGLQTRTNVMLESLIDATIRNTRAIEELKNQLEKQQETLSAIARNTANGPQQSTLHTQLSIRTQQKYVVKDYGFNNPVDVAAELLIRILKQAEIKIKSRGLDYRSSRSCDRNFTINSIKIVMKCDFRDPIMNAIQTKLPENKDTSTLKVASRIGTLGGIQSVVTPESIRELVMDPECRTFMSAFEGILERLRAVKVGLPFYESDILASIGSPYFNKDGELICEWNNIRSRQESELEREVYVMKAMQRSTLLEMLAKGVPLRHAIVAVRKPS